MCFFYLNSLASINNTPIPEIQSFLEDLFRPRMNIYKDAKLIGLELARCSAVPLDIVEPTAKEIEMADKYGTIEEDDVHL